MPNEIEQEQERQDAERLGNITRGFPLNMTPITPEVQAPEVLPVQDVVKNNNLVLSMRMQRTRDGIKLYLKSSIIEDFIKAATKGRTNNEDSTWNMERYKEVGLQNFTLNGTTFNAWGASMYVSGAVVNLSFLRGVGLSNGIEYTLNEMATKEKLEKFTSDFKNCVKSFYREFMKPFDISVDITVEESRSTGNNPMPQVAEQAILVYDNSLATWKYNNIPVSYRVTDAIYSRNKISAIKEFRIQYGLGLAESKVLIEQLEEQYRIRAQQ